MSASHLRQVGLALSVLSLVSWPLLMGCAGAAPDVTLSRYGAEVETGTRDAAPGMRDVGPIEVTHGGCYNTSRTGSYESAHALLRNEAARRGATYVKILQVVDSSPVDTSCVKIRGLAYGPGG